MHETLANPVAPERPVPPSPVSFEDFLAWADEDVHAEWVDGKVVVLSPASTDHQRLRDFLLRLIGLFLEARPLGELFSAPYLMRTVARPSGREPDLLFLAAEHADRVTPTYLNGPADLVVEIISPESEERDRAEKYLEYEAAGIPEYWLLDPLRQEATFYRLGADQRYHRAPLDADDVFHSTVLPGFWLNVAWLWQRPQPRVVELLREIMG